MAHTARDKEKLLLRVRRIRGQVDAVERGLAEEGDCFTVLQTVTAARGALTSLMVEIIDGHVNDHILDPAQEPTTAQKRAAEQLLEVVRAFLK
jgi:DNA-binding FrmR family transcriptional regulator